MAKKILVIEDSLLLCHILEEALQNRGFEVSVAHDGKGGFLKADACRPDLIILDLILPDMPGEQVCRNLKKHPDLAQTPVMMVTGKDSDVDHVVGKVLGAQAYVSKPFDLEHLLIEIQKLVAGFFVVWLCLGGTSAHAQDVNDTQIPAGMELIKVGEHSVYVAQGTKVTQRGSQLVLEPPDEFIARKILSLEHEIAALKQREEELLRRIDELSKAVERLSPLKSTEAQDGPA